MRSLWRCAADFVGDFAMSRLLGLSGIRSLEQFKSLSGSSSRPANKKIMPNASLGTPESVSSGSFANLKLTAGCTGLSLHFFIARQILPIL